MIKKTIILAAGGTGGHVFPAYALAEHLLKEGHRVHLITDARGAQFKNQPKGLTIATLPLGRHTHELKAKIRLILSLIPGLFISLYHLLREEPSVVLGFGGFPSVPTILGAILLRPFTHHKIVLHEQNAVIGRANRYFLPYVHILATSFPTTHGIKKSLKRKIHLAGNLVRPAFQNTKKAYALHTMRGPVRLLVVGGSQGARSFSIEIPKALAKLPLEVRENIHVVQQSRPELVDETQRAYEKLGVHVTTKAFFENIHDLMEKAHLIICRSGSSTVFEVAQSKRPAIYIPFPHAMDNHQYFNALSIHQQKGGWVLEEKDFKKLPALLKTLLKEPKKLATAAQNVHDLVGKDTLGCFLDLIQTVSLKKEDYHAH